MVAASRCLGLLAVSGYLLESSGARLSRKQQHDPMTKFVNGVPILNYHMAYGNVDDDNDFVNLAENPEDRQGYPANWPQWKIDYDIERKKRVAAYWASKGIYNLAQQQDVKQSWVVVAKPGTTDTHIQTACQAHGAGCVLAGHPSRGGMPFFKIHGTEEELGLVLQSIGSQAKFVEPDGKASAPPDMPSVQSTASWGLERVGVPEASKTGKGVHVYVCDTGIRVTHQDFGGRAIPALDMSSGSLKECNGSPGCAGDAQGHGTHCAGTVGGKSFGVAPQALLHNVKVLSDSGSGDWSWSYSALDWLATTGERPAVASMSLGGSGTQSAMKVAVDTAVDSGVTVVVAGGNDNSDACGFSPAFVPKAITVGSTTEANRRSSFSNYGSCTDIWAPGSDIVSASYASDSGSSTLSGTSMACPHVSGGAALLLEGNANLKSADIIDEMLSTAITNGIGGLKSDDTNKMLWVGAGPAPVLPAPAPDTCPYDWCSSYCWYGPCADCAVCR